MEIQETPVLLIGDPSGNRSSGTFKRKLWTESEARRRALKAWLFCWGIAVLAVPFPLIHFVFVPLGILLGPVLAFYFLRQRSSLSPGEGLCPDCQQTIPLPPGSTENLPRTDFCPHCRHCIRTHPAESHQNA